MSNKDAEFYVCPSCGRNYLTLEERDQRIADLEQRIKYHEAERENLMLACENTKEQLAKTQEQAEKTRQYLSDLLKLYECGIAWGKMAREAREWVDSITPEQTSKAEILLAAIYRSDRQR